MNSRKIKFTLIALVVAFVMLVSATYAWFTLSTKPEISGIQTNIGANGSLEIALLTPQTFMHPEEIKASIGSSMVNQEVTYSNLFWGNVIDLSDESYGLGQISLLPSRLDISARNGEQTVVSGGLLTVPDYGLDGRFSYFNPHVVSASYDPPYFRYSADVSFHGVRGIGTISRVTVQQAALNNARTSIQSYESATRRAMESVWRANGDALFDILYRLHGLETQEFTSADVAVILDTCSRMLGVMDYLDAATRQGIVAVFAELIWDESQFLALKSMVENPANSLTDLEDMLDAQAYLQYSYSQTLSQLIQYVPQDQQALRDIMQQCYALEGTVPDRNTIYNLLHTNLLSRDHTFINENNLFNFPSELVRDNTLTLAPTDIYYTNTGIMNHIQSYAGGYNVLFTYKDSYSISVDGNDYNQRSVLSSLSSELSLLSGSGMVNEDTALLDKTYGYAIDLAVRCNTDSDLLLQTVAADRVDPNATPDPDGLLSDTQGSGSYMRFNGSVFKDQMVPLMDAIRIGFLDNRNNLIAVAKLNTSNYTEEGNEITAPLYLYDYSVAQDGSLSMGERRKDDNMILPLPEDTATVLTVVVWLDGDHVPNSFVSIMGNSIDGTLNLQFASSAELNPAFKDDPDATKPDETKPVEPSDAYYLSTDNGQYAFYTLGADGSRNYTLPFSGTVDEENHTVIIDSISAYPEQGIWIPALATSEADGEQYSISIDPSAPFKSLTADNVHIAFVPVDGSKVGITAPNLSYLFDANGNNHSMYRSLNLSGLDTSGSTNMTHMFWGCSGLTRLDLSSIDTSGVTDMSWMFYGCSGLTELDISGFDTAKVTNMDAMFWACENLTELDVSGFDTASVTSMYRMFFCCFDLAELDLRGFDTLKVVTMEGMFNNCSSLTELSLSSFDTSKVTDTAAMLSGCKKLLTIVTPNVIGDVAIELPGSYLCETNGITYTSISKNVPTQATLSKVVNDSTDDPNLTIVDTGNINDNISWTVYENGLLRLEGIGAMPNYSAASDGPWYGYRESITAVEIGEGITYLGLGNLASIDYAEITIPESVAAIAGHNGWGGQYKTVHYAGSEQQWNAIAIFDPNNTLIGGTLNAEQGNASILHSGTIVSTDISWTLYADGILTINGTGAMPDWTETNTAPWDEYANNIKYLVISNGIKYVGSYAFDGLSNLQSVKIAGSVTALGEYAFSECRNLLAVVIGEGSALQRVDQYCFNWCANLRYINMPDTVNELGALAFACCEALDRIMINDVTTMGDYTFFACESLTSITLAEGLRIIPDGAFARCFSLSEVTIPSTVTEIGTEAFFMDYNDSILVVNYADYSERWALISVGYRNDGLDNAVFNFKAVTVTDSGNVNEGITWVLDDAGTLIFSGTGDMPDYNRYGNDYTYYPNWRNLDYHTVIICDGITSIGNYAFINADDLTTVIITPSITNISWYAFEGCSSPITICVLGREDEFLLTGWAGSQPDNITFNFYQ